MKRPSIFISGSLLISSVLYAAEGTFHVVKNGETLSYIAHKTIPGRVYGKRGSLERILSLNSELKDPNRIYIGQRILISAEPKNQISGTSGSERRSLASSDAPGTEKPEAGWETVPAVKNPEEPSKACETPRGEPAAKPKESDDIYHHLDFFGGYQFTTLHALDRSSSTSANLFSSHDVEAGAAWKQNWSESFASFFSLAVRKVDFSPSTNPNKTLSGTNKTLVDMRAGGQSRLGGRLNLKYSIGYANELFVHGVNSNTVTVDSIALPSVNMGADFQLYSKGKTSFGLTGSASYLLGATSDGYDVNNGTAFGGGIFLRRESESGSLGLHLGYTQRDQNTSLTKFSESAVHGIVTFSLPLFNGGPK